MLHVRPGATVEFSEYALLLDDEGRLYSPFQRDSYSARVVLEGDGTVFVVLPKHARHRRPESQWVSDVIQSADLRGDTDVVVMPDE